MRVLLLEDDTELSAALRSALERRAMVVDVVETLADAREALAGDVPYAVAVFDRRVPDGDGLDLVSVARARRDSPAVLMLTALDEVRDRVRGLDIGADDYVAKPFDVDELAARLRAVCRRRTPVEARTMRIGRLTLDLDSREVRVGGDLLNPPRRELIALETLMRRAGRVVTRDALEAAMWGFDDDVRPDAIEPHISRLRRRLSESGAGVTIHATRGVGYSLRAENAEDVG